MQSMYHPAPGLGDLLPGWLVVPQNPVRAAETALVPTVQALAPGAIMRKPHMGDFLPASFVVPQNPIRKTLASNMNGLGCGGNTGANFYGMSGMGATAATTTVSPFSSMAAFQAWLQAPSSLSASIPNWMLYGGGAAALLLFLNSQKKGGR